MTEATYTVEGMTCGHCAGAVKEEVSGLTGVQTVDVDLATGAVKVTSQEPLPRDAVEAAVAEAGYQVVA
ncbi:heavy-metal-associated domain-containing protein [Amycolatopsis jejuensis]|uniref:heavy-metal-associated domain-containing protein n=1 Tax=Amycolatopsis jejuensis TaxID=330084 RepID=UPI0005244372|nr:heavy-metal-associated domain-containing protein [Amycolatopsis jejuensis]